MELEASVEKERSRFGDLRRHHYKLSEQLNQQQQQMNMENEADTEGQGQGH